MEPTNINNNYCTTFNMSNVEPVDVFRELMNTVLKNLSCPFQQVEQAENMRLVNKKWHHYFSSPNIFWKLFFKGKGISNDYFGRAFLNNSKFTSTLSFLWAPNSTARILAKVPPTASTLLQNNEMNLVFPNGKTPILSDTGLLSWVNFPNRDEELTIQNLSADGRIVRGAKILSENRMVTWSENNFLYLWDVSQSEASLIQILEGSQGSVQGVLVLPEDKMVSWSSQGILHLWDINMPEASLIQTLEEPIESIKNARVIGDGKIATLSWDGILRIWDISNPKEGFVHVLEEVEARIIDVLSLGNSRLVSSSADNKLRLWELHNEEARLVTILDESVRSLLGIQSLADGRVVGCSNTDNALWIWDISETENLKVQKLTGHTATIIGLHVFSDDRILSLSLDGTFRLWNLNSPDNPFLLNLHGLVQPNLMFTHLARSSIQVRTLPNNGILIAFGNELIHWNHWSFVW